jgi:hypothetical protein
MNATPYEIQLSRVLALQRELDGGNPPDQHEWHGYGLGYGIATKDVVDEATARLCARLEPMATEELQSHSLELQIWWRDHLISDVKRKTIEEYRASLDRIKQRALEKLTDAERIALGLKDELG